MGEFVEEDNILPLVKNNKVKLRQSSEPVTEDDDWEGLKDLLYSNLAHYGGIGLSAVQLGIYKSACVVNVKEPIFLVNPEIVEAQGNTKYVEGCLSFPNDVVATERYTEILVEADNFDKRLHFAPDDEDLIPASYEDNMEMEDDGGLLECIAVQHELDHTEGVLFFDRRAERGETYEKEKTQNIGRNDRVKVRNEDGVVSTVKYKHVNDQIESGNIELLEVVN